MVILVRTGMRTAPTPSPQFSPLPPPPSAAGFGTNKLILCSCIWCQQAPFVRPEPAESGGFVQRRRATGGRKMGTLSSQRLEVGGMPGWQPGPEVIGSWGQSGGSGARICHPNPLPGPEGGPWEGVTCPAPLVPSQQAPGYPRDGVISAGIALPHAVGHGAAPQALHPLTDSRAPPRAHSCSNRHHHQGLL